MKVKQLRLAWFRGAASEAELKLGLKSLVVYGDNGAGKSSFVDGIEYILSQGRIRHLAHEYSGRRQEKAILNTHTPPGKQCMIEVTLEDDSRVAVSIAPNGNFSVSPQDHNITQWLYQHTILRQNELADFIADTKGGKYSSLLPLLGLSDLEIAAENLRKLEKAISDEFDLTVKKDILKDINNRANKIFKDEGKGYKDELDRFYQLYLDSERSPEDEKSIDDATQEVLTSLESRINELSEEHKTHTALLELSSFSTQDVISDVRDSSSKLAQSTEPLIKERLSILREASVFATQLTPEETVDCPACGSTVSVDSFQSHVKKEEERLKTVLGYFDDLKRNIQSLCDILRNIKQSCGKNEVAEWKKELDSIHVQYLSSLDIDKIRKLCTEEDLREIEIHLDPIILAATEATQNTPPEIKELLNDKNAALLIKELVESKLISVYISEIESLIGYISLLQANYRDNIREKSNAAIESISDDIAKMWGILHPDEKIEDVHLYLPSDSEKAIEIGLKFYGVELPSPRLTLSEGHRNSLGLCIFLSMAKHSSEHNTPIILDDVVVSFDRSHRGMVAEILETEFHNRQVILFTHDREWFIELKQLLNPSSWEFRALMPWLEPKVGIRWSEKNSTFDDALSFIEVDPSAAGNTARKIMDIHLALISEKLEIRLPYLHRERNDHRVAHDFLKQIISAGSKCFKIKDSGTYQPYASAIEALEKADKLLIAWANRASHRFDTAKSEAKILIATCESALDLFNCSSCRRSVIKCNDSSAKIRQCECGNLRWSYG